jgi:hypothetical protein
MSLDTLWKLLHVLSVGFFGGGVLALLVAESLILRSLDDADRRSLARAANSSARIAVLPLTYVGFLTGVVFWLSRYSFNGAGRLMACTPIYVHVMLLGGFLAVGMTHAWAGRTRKMALAAEQGAPAEAVRSHARKAFLFGGIALLLTVGTFVVAIVKVPNPPLRRCAVEAPASPG